jgi:2'-5' RNA ligase
MRLFIAFPVDKDLRRRMQESWNTPGVAVPLAGAPRDPNDWHVTLFFLGEVEEKHVEIIREATENLISFLLKDGYIVFSHWGTFGGDFELSPVVLKGCPMPDDGWRQALAAFLQAVRPYAADIEFRPWIPHVTIGKATRLAAPQSWRQEIAPIVWRPKEIVLFMTDSSVSPPAHRRLWHSSLKS